MSEDKPARHRQPYSDWELRVILGRPPTWSSVAEMAGAFERTQDAIKLVYTIATLPVKDLSPKMKDGATWLQIRRIAGELGYIRIGKRELRKFARPCPKCERKGIPIVYGYPTDATSKRAAEGEIFLGGCMPLGDSWYCSNCDVRW